LNTRGNFSAILKRVSVPILLTPCSTYDSLNIADMPLKNTLNYFLKNFGSESTISENTSIISSPND